MNGRPGSRRGSKISLSLTSILGALGPKWPEGDRGGGGAYGPLTYGIGKFDEESPFQSLWNPDPARISTGKKKKRHEKANRSMERFKNPGWAVGGTL